MADQLTDKDLCQALSDLFVDSLVDYDAIAFIARRFPLGHVETVLFEWVAPVCHANTLSPIPSIWTGFEPERLWRDIAEHRRKEARAGLIGRGIARARRFYLRRKFAQEWRQLAELLSKTPT